MIPRGVPGSGPLQDLQARNDNTLNPQTEYKELSGYLTLQVPPNGLLFPLTDSNNMSILSWSIYSGGLRGGFTCPLPVCRNVGSYSLVYVFSAVLFGLGINYWAAGGSSGRPDPKTLY